LKGTKSRDVSIKSMDMASTSQCIDFIPLQMSEFVSLEISRRKLT